MTTTTTPAPALNRRALLSRVLAGAAGAAIGATAVMPRTAKAAVSGDDAEIFALIAEEERLYSIGESYDSQLRELMAAQPDEVRFEWYRDLDNLPEPAASLYRNSKPWFEAADRVMYRIQELRPKTVEGAAALLRLAGDESPVVANVIAALPDLAGRGVAA